MEYLLYMHAIVGAYRKKGKRVNYDTYVRYHVHIMLELDGSVGHYKGDDSLNIVFNMFPLFVLAICKHN